MTVDEPTYKIALSQGNIEVRDYPEVAVAEVTVAGDRKAAGNIGFKMLAGYIFGGNVGHRRFAMTAPVIVALNESTTAPNTKLEPAKKQVGSWLIRFIMPTGKLLDMLPKPNDSRVHLRNAPASRIATLRFSGLASESRIKRKTEELHTFLDTHHLRPVGSSYLARYNPPWTLWFMRRNEVMIPVEKTL